MRSELRSKTTPETSRSGSQTASDSSVGGKPWQKLARAQFGCGGAKMTSRQQKFGVTTVERFIRSRPSGWNCLCSSVLRSTHIVCYRSPHICLLLLMYDITYIASLCFLYYY